MSEIDGPSNIPLQAGEAATRVTRASTTSDDSSTQQQSSDKKTTTPKKNHETKEQPATHETAVIISTSLSNLEAGISITANYQGIDGQNRPSIVSDTGTYVVKFDIAHQPDIDKIPQDATLEIRILKVEREIEARLIYRDPTAANINPPQISIPVTLELTGLGSAPPTVRSTDDQSHQPPDKQKLSYQASDLYRAEHIARESTTKMNELPLPATTNYTLYERAVPQHDRPAIIRSSIAGNALLAQEQVTKVATQTPQTSLTGASKVKTDPLTIDVEKLLHKDIFSTVIKNIPKVAVDLPEIVRKHLAATTPLDNLKAGSNFTLRIHSIAIPDTRPQAEAELQAKSNAQTNSPVATVITSKTPPQSPSIPVEDAKNMAAVVQSPINARAAFSPQKPSTATSPKAELSGIVIAPGQDIIKNSDQNISANAPPPVNRKYASRYNPSSFTQPNRAGADKTLYVATPVSVIKFQSPVELKPGTVINFSLPKSDIPVRAHRAVKEAAHPEQKPDAKPAADASAPGLRAKPAPENQTSGWTPTSLVTRPDLPASPPLELAPQPLEKLTQGWQSLSQILSVIPAADSSAATLNNRLPGVQSPGQMTSTMLFFLAAMGAKNPAKIWLGPVVTQQLEKLGHGKLLTMLNNDMQRIFRLGAETPPNEWRPALIPLQAGGEVHAIPILTRQVQDDDHEGGNNTNNDEDNKKNAATRFIVELDLSQFGQIQVDGLLKAKKLNIIIRSKIILAFEMKQRMTQMFTTALEISGYTGDLQFRDNDRTEISVQNIINRKVHMSGP